MTGNPTSERLLRLRNKQKISRGLIWTYKFKLLVVIEIVSPLLTCYFCGAMANYKTGTKLMMMMMMMMMIIIIIIIIKTPWTSVLPEKLTVPQLVKKFPAHCGIQRSITAFTSTRYLSLFSATTIHITGYPIARLSILLDIP
jgi:hypothetical protein